MSEKNREKRELVHDPEDVPEGLSDEEQIQYWETHDVTEEYLAKVEEAPEDERPRPRTRPINVRFDDHTLGRLKALADRRDVGYQTLLKQFVAERLYEEEKREGVLSTGQWEAFGTRSQEAPNDYSEFLNSVLWSCWKTLSTATQVAQGNVQQAEQATQQSVQAVVQAASQAGKQAMEAASQADQQAARGEEQVAWAAALADQRGATGVPIRNYDTSNVAEIVEQLDNLSADELQRLRVYERQHKDRDSLLGQIDRKINTLS